MKKYFFSGLFIVAFVVYAISQANSKNNTLVPIPNPASSYTAPSDSAASSAAAGAPPASTASASGSSTASTAAPASSSTAGSSSAPASSKSSGSSAPPAKPVITGRYKPGTYTGSAADAYYGNVQVQAVVDSTGHLANVQFLQYPSDARHSAELSAQAMPILKSEAISAQSANVDLLSGATDTSKAFQQSLQSALSQAS